MTRRRWAEVTAALAAATVAACEPENPTAPSPGATGQLLTIVNHQVLPASLPVVPGSTVLLRNEDPVRHSVTSEAARDAFTPGAVAGFAFDTGPFTGNRAFAIPAGAVPGTVFPFFCREHPGSPAEQGELVVASP